MSDAGSGETSLGGLRQLRDEITALRASRRRLAEAAHADRRALERELHDGLQQNLVALAMELQRLDRLMDGDAGVVKAGLTEMSGIVGEALEQAAALATRIYPNLVDGHGFASALRSAASTAGVTAVVDAPAEAGYPPEIAAALFWSWTEALTSASDVSAAKIDIVDEDGGLRFEITVAGQYAEGGMVRTRDRIEALDGRVSDDASQRASSRIQGWLPLPR